MMYWNDLAHHLGCERLARLWLAHPTVRAAVNQRVTGRADCWPTEWFARTFARRLPLGRGVVLGCGSGSLERDLVQKGICTRVVGVDLAPEPLQHAAQQAVAAGMGTAIEYVQGDARSYLAAHPQTFDGVFFHGSLHHFDRLDELMVLIRQALTRQGLLYLDEYVGPSMEQWNSWRLLPANVAYYLLPSVLRRPRLVRAPRNPADPGEAVAAAEILPALRRHFTLLEQRDYGGNLLGLVFPNLKTAAEGACAADLEGAVRRLLSAEDLLLRCQVKSHYTVVVAESKSSHSG